MTTRLGRFAGEIIRIIEYQKKFIEGDTNFTMASIQRGLDYLKKI